MKVPVNIKLSPNGFDEDCGAMFGINEGIGLPNVKTVRGQMAGMECSQISTQALAFKQLSSITYVLPNMYFKKLRLPGLAGR